MVACEVSQRHPTEALRCPRCDSSDTKFCYFNNYNTSQPRHFCKSCKRYWTAGGSLRNVPVGGGLRKNKKSKLLNQVRDLVSSSSSDELLQSSLAANPSFAVTNKVLQYDSSIPLSFASPLLMTAPSSSPDFARDGTLGNPYAFRSLNTANYGFFAENRMDDFATPVDPSLVNSMSARPQPHSQADYVRTLPEALQRQWNGGSHVSLASIVADQAQSYSGCISEVPSEASQASFEMMKDPHASKSTDLHACQLDQTEATEEKSNKICRDECLDSIVVIGQENVGEHCNGVKQEKEIEESVRTGDNQLRDVSSTEEDDDLGNVVNVRYPYDWDQVSEVLFGGATDFFQLSGY